MKTPKGPQSGKRGKVVASRNHFGSYERAHTSPKKDRTPAQQRTTAGFGVMSISIAPDLPAIRLTTLKQFH